MSDRREGLRKLARLGQQMEDGMSEFQLGDKVRVHACPEDYGGVMPCCGLPPGESGGDQITVVPQFVTCGVDDPFVPDVDGNPIRVGQLVEAIECNDVPPFFGCRFVDRVNPDAGEASVPGAAWWNSDMLRVVTDTFRPPEPDTRDVTLRVTFRDSPSAIPAGGLINDVAGALEHFGLVDFTVEVVDEGGHDDA